MKSKTIQKILNGKFNSWINSIDNKEIREIAKQSTIITGGCITSFYLNENVNDFDIYFKDIDSATKIAKYYVEVFNKKVQKSSNEKTREAEIRVDSDTNRIKVYIKSSGITSDTTNNKDYQYFETLDPGSPEQEEFISSATDVLKKSSSGRYQPIFLTSNAITLTNKIQLVIRFYGSPEEIHKNYDFIHCTNYWTSWNKKLVITKEALESIITKELKYTGSLYPICSVLRLRKFIKRGWTINGGQILKMAFQIKDLDLENPKVLADQLIGVDVAYFTDLINKINSEKPEVIDSLYISRIIGEIF